MTEEEAKIYNWILDSFGEPVFQGDWIYYTGRSVGDISIGRVYDFTKGGTPRLEYVCHKDAFNNTEQTVNCIKRKHSKTIIHRAFVRCYNQALIETLENLIIENGVQKVTIEAQNSGYIPSYFTVKKGVPVELTVQSMDVYSCAADFVFKEFGISVFLGPTDSKTFNFTPTKKGKFTYSCSMGMYSGVMEVL